MPSERERRKEQARKTSATEWAKSQTKGFEATAVKLPEGIEFYKLEVGTHAVDFMPFLAGKGNPRADEGFEHFEREYDAHRVPTPASTRPNLYCCSWTCFGRKCAVCDYLRHHANSGDPDLVKLLRATRRHLWLVNDKPGDADNPLKVFDSNHFNKGTGFGEMMADAINSVPKYARFADLRKGMTLQLTVKELSGGKFKYNAVTRIDFLSRDYDYPEEMLDRAPCLDAMLVEPKYATVAALLNQESPEEGATTDELVEEVQEETPPPQKVLVKHPSPKPARPELETFRKSDPPRLTTPVQPAKKDSHNKRAADSKDRELAVGDVVHYKGEEMQILKISSKGLLTLEQQEPDQEWPDVPAHKVTKITGKESTPAPAKNHAPAGKNSVPAKGKVSKDDEDFDDEPEEEEEIEFEEDEDSEDIEEEDEDEDLDEEEDLDKKPTPRLGPGRPRRPA